MLNGGNQEAGEEEYYIVVDIIHETAIEYFVTWMNQKGEMFEPTWISKDSNYISKSLSDRWNLQRSNIASTSTSTLVPSSLPSLAPLSPSPPPDLATTSKTDREALDRDAGLRATIGDSRRADSISISIHSHPLPSKPSLEPSVILKEPVWSSSSVSSHLAHRKKKFNGPKWAALPVKGGRRGTDVEDTNTRVRERSRTPPRDSYRSSYVTSSPNRSTHLPTRGAESTRFASSSQESSYQTRTSCYRSPSPSRRSPILPSPRRRSLSPPPRRLPQASNQVDYAPHHAKRPIYVTDYERKEAATVPKTTSEQFVGDCEPSEGKDVEGIVLEEAEVAEVEIEGDHCEVIILEEEPKPLSTSFGYESTTDLEPISPPPPLAEYVSPTRVELVSPSLVERLEFRSPLTLISRIGERIVSNREDQSLEPPSSVLAPPPSPTPSSTSSKVRSSLKGRRRRASTPPRIVGEKAGRLLGKGNET